VALIRGADAGDEGDVEMVARLSDAQVMAECARMELRDAVAPVIAMTPAPVTDAPPSRASVTTPSGPSAAPIVKAPRIDLRALGLDPSEVMVCNFVNARRR
jgi:hypothetical protein